MFGLNPSVFWIICVMIFAIIEGATLGLTAIWFAIGALGSALVAYFGASPLIQVMAFIAVSALTLIYTRPFVAKSLKVKKTATNLDRAVGQQGMVTETIDNEAGTGQAKIGGLMWTARNVVKEPIPVDSQVEVVAIEGVKVIVKFVK